MRIKKYVLDLLFVLVVSSAQESSQDLFKTIIQEDSVVFFTDNFTQFQEAQTGIKNDNTSIKWAAFSVYQSDFGLDVGGISLKLLFGYDGTYEQQSDAFGYLTFIPLYFKFKDLNHNKIFDREEDAIISVFDTTEMQQPQFHTEFDVLDKSTTYYVTIYSVDGHFGATCKLRDVSLSIANDKSSKKKQKGKNSSSSVEDKGEPSRMKCDVRVMDFEIENPDEGIAIVFFFVSSSLSIENANAGGGVMGLTTLSNLQVGSSAAFFSWEDRMLLVENPLDAPQNAAGSVLLQVSHLTLAFKEIYAILLLSKEIDNGAPFNLEAIKKKIETLDVDALLPNITIPVLPQGLDTEFVASIFSVMPPVGVKNILWDPSIGVLLSGSSDGNGGTGNGGGGGGDGALFHQFGTMEVIWIIAWCLFIVVGVICLIAVIAYSTSKRFRKIIRGSKKPSKNIRAARKSRKELELSTQPPSSEVLL